MKFLFDLKWGVVRKSESWITNRNETKSPLPRDRAWGEATKATK